MSEAKKIERLKRTARDAYWRHAALADQYSCGISLATYISADIFIVASEFNAAMAELKSLDPQCPPYDPLPEGPRT
jgi:hypothetical protein